jgi:hypothetical protein
LLCEEGFSFQGISVNTSASAIRARKPHPMSGSLTPTCSNMRTPYLRNVPDEVVERLERLAARDGTSVGAVAVRELADVTRRGDNPAMLGALPNPQVDVGQIVDDLRSERAAQ